MGFFSESFHPAQPTHEVREFTLRREVASSSALLLGMMSGSSGCDAVLTVGLVTANGQRVWHSGMVNANPADALTADGSAPVGGTSFTTTAFIRNFFPNAEVQVERCFVDSVGDPDYPLVVTGRARIATGQLSAALRLAEGV